MRNRKRAWILGGKGFVGPHLAQSLGSQFEVTVTGRECDVTRPGDLESALTNACPDVVVNLASVTTVQESFQDPIRTYRIGFFGTLNLLCALKSSGFSGKLLNVSSSEVYGFPAEAELPITEKHQIRPMSPYSVSKVATEALCHQWSQTEQFEIISARPFTHIGPGQSDRFAVSRFARQVAEIVLDMREAVVNVGNIDTTRDLTDVRDVTRAYGSLLAAGISGETYNVCSGREVSMALVVDLLVELVGVPIKICQETSLQRPREQRRIVGSYQKLADATAWSPSTPLATSIRDILDHWIDTLKQPKSTAA